jgi:Putative MetA-pathway of phenol degradation
MAVGIYSHTSAGGRGQNEDAGTLLFETPISRRWMVGVSVPVVDSLAAGGGAPSATGFGDVVLENRFLLTETQDTTLSFNFNIRTPTGDTKIGADQTRLIPYLAFWQDMGKGVSVRGGAGFDVPVDCDPNQHGTIGFVNLAIGQTITEREAAPLGDFTYYVAINLSRNLGSNDSTSVTLTPGVRTHLGNDWFFLAGVEVPVTGPLPFNERFTFVLVKGF